MIAPLATAAVQGGPDSEILGPVRDLGAAVYMAAVAKFPARNIQLRQGAHIVKRHHGELLPLDETRRRH